MKDIELKKRGVYLGKTGETGRYRVWLDVSAWAEEYSGGTGLLLYTDPKGNTAPMRTTVEFDGEKTKIYGLVTEEETKESGTGVIEARWMAAGVVAKSDHYNTVVMESIYTGQNVGDNTPDWVRDLMTELNAVDVLIDEAKQMADQVDDILATIEGAETAAVEAAGDSEAWAVGKRGGVDVEAGDQTYQHNSLYYAMQAGGMANAARDQAREAEAWAVGQRAGLDVETTDGTYHNNAKYYAQHAREEAEAWAVGKRSGTDVGSEDPAYHNNAKYYSEHAFSATPEGYEALVDDVDLMMESFEAERSGRVVLVPAGTGTPVKDLKVYIEAAQDLSYGAPSQSNVRPITGHAQLFIYRVGKNLFNKDAEEQSPNNTATAVGTKRIFAPYKCCRGIGGDNGYSASDVTTFSISGDSVLVKSTNGYGAGFAVPVAGGQGYVLTANTVSNGEARVICYKADGTPVIMGSGNMLGVPFTAPEDAEMAVIVLNPPASLNGTRTATFTKVQLEAGPTATAYEAYSVDGAAMSAYGYAGYVYGGYWDVDAKKLYVTHKNIASYAGETLPGRWISSMETYAAGRTPTTGAQVVYELAQPEVYDLTNEVHLNTLTGFCEFWAPTGRVEMSVTMSLKGRVEALEKAAEVSDLKSEINDINTAIGYSGEQESSIEVDITALRNENHFWNSEGTVAVLTSYSGYCSYDALSVVPGEKYSVRIYRQSSAKQHAVLLVDGNLNIVASYGQGTGSSDGLATYDFTVPSGATKMLLTTGNDRTLPTVTKTISVEVLNSVPDLIDRVDNLEEDGDGYSTRLDDIEGDIDDIIDAIGYEQGGHETQVTVDVSSYANDNHYWNSQAETAVLTAYNGYRSYDNIPVQQGEKYSVYIFRKSSAKQHAVLLTDSELTILASYGVGTVSSDGWSTYDFTVPFGAVYMLLTTGQNSGEWQGLTVHKIITETTLNSVPDLIKRVDAVLTGKTVAVIGDSISTNGTVGTDANAVELTVTAEDVGVQLSAYLTYYDVQAGLSLGGHTFTSAEIGTEVTFTPVEADIGKVIGLSLTYNPNSTTVWWEVMQKALGNTTIPVCWSGASVTSHEGDQSIYKTSYAWHDAQIRKCGIRTPGSMTRTAPDVIIIYRGTNDFSHASYAKLTAGYFDNYNWQYPNDDAVTGGYGYKEGLCLTVKKLRAAYPSAKIFLCTLNVFKRVNYSHFPTNNGTNSLPQYNAAIREVADFLGCGLIEFDKDGITFENCYSGGYVTDSETTPTHPSNKGHKVMGNKAIADIRAQYGAME